MVSKIDWIDGPSGLRAVVEPIVDEAKEIMRTEESVNLMIFHLLNKEADFIKAALDAGATEDPSEIARDFASWIFQWLCG